MRLPNFRQVSSQFLNQLNIMSGWGRDIFNPLRSSLLRFTNFRTIPNLSCRLSYPNIIESSQLCSLITNNNNPFCPVSLFCCF